MDNSKTRNYGIDFLRIVLILFIIFHHTILRGTVGLRSLESGNFNIDQAPFVFVNCFLIVAVNCFFLISGYFGIHKNYKKLIKFVCSVYFFYWVINIVALLLGVQTFTLELLKGLIFPISQYWFILVYLVLSFLAPYVEIMLETLDLADQRILICVLIVLWMGYCFLIDNVVLGANRGYSLNFAIILYIIGNYLRKRDFKIKSQDAFLIYISSCVINGILVGVMLFFNKQLVIWKLYSYNNPLVVIGAVSLFLVFLQNDGQLMRKISYLGKYTIYIYIVHSTPVFANWYMEGIESFCKEDLLRFVIVAIVTVSILFLLGLLLGIVYENIWKKIETKILISPNFKKDE